MPKLLDFPVRQSEYTAANSMIKTTFDRFLSCANWNGPVNVLEIVPDQNQRYDKTLTRQGKFIDKKGRKQPGSRCDLRPGSKQDPGQLTGHGRERVSPKDEMDVAARPIRWSRPWRHRRVCGLWIAAPRKIRPGMRLRLSVTTSC